MESSNIKLTIKWGKQVFNDVELNFNDDIETFKGQLYALTNVPVHKQKVMAKGKMLKDDTQWKDYPGVKAGAVLMLMGTAEGNELQAPAQQMKFVEDMTPEEKAAALRIKTGVAIPAGLENLGNTCYMNSVVQCLKRVDELKDTIKGYEAQGQGMDPGTLLTSSAKMMFEDLDTKGEPFAPYHFVQTMRQVFPQFNETDDKGHHKQQDADECYTQFLTMFQQSLRHSKQVMQTVKDKDGDAQMEGDGQPQIQEQVTVQVDPVNDLFGIELESTLENSESVDEKQVSTENLQKLSCHIDNNNKPIDSLQDGLKISLGGQIEKYSDALGRNALWNKTSKVNKLPSYICINFVRFYWKKESAVGGTKAGRAKILRSVAYPRLLDLFEFCSESLQKTLLVGRGEEEQQRIAQDEARLEGKKKMAEESDKMMKGEIETQTEDQRKQKQVVGKAARAQEKAEEDAKHDEILYRPHGQGKDTGNYELVAIVTHKGRSAEGGHYVGWVHSRGEEWLCFDDDIVTTVKSDEILQLRGGGDWHTAYLAIYRKLETDPALGAKKE